jgi:DNA-binding NarL/FixJ family response regulator
MHLLTKIAFVDDQELFRKGVISLNDDVPAFELLFEANNGKELIEKLKKHIPELVLLDLDMPIMNGFETTAYLKQHYPNIKIIILTGHHEDTIIRKAIKQGAHGFLNKNTNIQAIKLAIEAVMSNGYYFNDKVSAALVKSMMKENLLEPTFKDVIQLTDKEIEVLSCIAIGDSTQEVANKLFVSENTVKTHRQHIIDKTKSKNIIAALMYAIKNNLLD